MADLHWQVEPSVKVFGGGALNTHYRRDLLGLFAQHPVAANLLMGLMVLSGLWALASLHTQFFPNFALDTIRIRVTWPGASPEDVERSITLPLEKELRSVDRVRKMTSTSATGRSVITLEFKEGTDMGNALDQVKEQVGRVTHLPEEAEEPQITLISRYDLIARLLITAPAEPHRLRFWGHRFEDELLEAGIAKIDVDGIPDEIIAIQVGSEAQRRLGWSLPEIARQVEGMSRDLPAGSAGRDDVARQLRSLSQRRRVLGFEDLPLQVGPEKRLSLGDVASIERRPDDGEVRLLHWGQPAVQLDLKRAETADALEGASIFRAWLAKVRGELPEGMALIPYDEAWTLIRERIDLLLKNGLGGFALVLAILYLFLNGRVATWVAVGIPVSFSAALAVLYLVGGSINMVSLFGLIMTLGIIVDDAIVVGEEALRRYQHGEDPLEAAENGARRMVAPVAASSLTTVAAFLPLMAIGGPIGNILFDIPLVVVCVILASLLESFFVLPGHLRHSFKGLGHHGPRGVRKRLDAAFQRFRDGPFRRLVTLAVVHRWFTLSAAVALLLLSLGLIAGGRLGFTFFPTPESTIVRANVSFVAGTSPKRVEAFMEHVAEALQETDKALGGIVVTAVTFLGEAGLGGENLRQRGDPFASMVVELVEPDRRSVRNHDFIAAWRSRIALPPGIDTLSISSRQAGPPGKDLAIRLMGDDPKRVKAAGEALAEAMRHFPGVFNITDDMPWGQEQLIYRLTPLGEALGLTTETLGGQLRAAFAGESVQVFYEGRDEVEVKVMLPDDERHHLPSLEGLSVFLPNGKAVPLFDVASLERHQGFDVLRHAQGKLAIEVSADVNTAVNNSNRIMTTLAQEVLPGIASRFGVKAEPAGRAEEQAETLGDMKRALPFALLLIYLVLAWVFASYTLPLVVMSVIPFALVGALFGHLAMGIDLTILTLFGLFGLSGIVVNDSIILVSFYQHMRDMGMERDEAIVEAACQRLRAVLLTSLTTIGGLLPLLFETSLQAQFLIPMAVTISFGLAFTTLLVLFLVPALLSIRIHRFRVL